MNTCGGEIPPPFTLMNQATSIVHLPINKRYHSLYINGEQIPPERMKITVNGELIWKGSEFDKAKAEVFGKKK